MNHCGLKRRDDFLIGVIWESFIEKVPFWANFEDWVGDGSTQIRGMGVKCLGPH